MAQDITIAFVVGFITNLLTNWLWDWFKEQGWIKKTEAAPVAESSVSMAARWLAVTGWGMLPLGYVMAALYLIERRWPLTLKEMILMLAAGFLVNLVLVAIGLLISVVWLKVGWSLGLMLVVIASEVGVLYLLDRSLPRYLAMDCPSKVESVTAIQGRIIDPDYRVYLLIKPRSVGNLYAMEPTSPGEDGTWFARGDFDGGAGAKYEISAAALRPEQVPENPIPGPEWLLRNAAWKTSICVVTKR